MRQRVIAASSLLVIAALIYLIGWSSFLTVSSVEIKTSDPKNLTLIEEELVRAGLTIKAGEPIARINVRAIERTLKGQPWIGEVRLNRNWLNGEVELFVRERIPRFRVIEIVRPSDPMIASGGARFMTADGTVFELPGDLATEYRGLPEIEVRGEEVEIRKEAATIFDAVDPLFPTKKIIITAIATFITESEVYSQSSGEQGGVRLREREARISWGDSKEIALKITVTQELLNLKANRTVNRIDVSNPRLPIVSAK